MRNAEGLTCPDAVPVERQLNRAFTFAWAFTLSAVMAFTLTLSAHDLSVSVARVGGVLGVLFIVYSLAMPRVTLLREVTIYSLLFGYMLLQLLWSDDLVLALNTLIPALDCLVAMLLLTSLMNYFDRRAVLAGVVFGFLVGSLYFTLTEGFPFDRYPDFPYNAIANMYLFGMFATLLLGVHQRHKWPYFALAVLLALHVLATTSIKANLGILLGLLAAGLFYFTYMRRLLGRYFFFILILTGGLVATVLSSEGLMRTLQSGFERASLGVQILQAREDLPGYSAYGQRNVWQGEGLRGWLDNPLFGHGVEAFRFEFGITSHSTPIDLLYNSGVIGLLLFYAIFASLAWRLLRARNLRGTGALVLAGVVCYGFMTLSGTMHYNTFLAGFFALAAAMLDEPVRT